MLAFVSGLPLSLFNGCVVVDRTTRRELESAIAWVENFELPFQVWIADELRAELADVPLEHGLDRLSPYPGMVLHPLPERPPPAPGVRVETVGAAGLDAFLRVSDQGGMPPDVTRTLFSEAFAGDPEIALFLGRVDGQPVGTSLAIRSSTAGGVYNVGTLPLARGRGVGTALTWAAVAAGRDWGHDTVVLQSSEMAFSLYRSLGFRTVASYATFERRPPRR